MVAREELLVSLDDMRQQLRTVVEVGGDELVELLAGVDWVQSLPSAVVYL